MTDFLDSHWTPCRDVILTTVGDEAVLLHTGTNVYFGLDPLGVLVFQRLADKASPRQILSEIVKQFAVDDERAVADLTALISDLSQHGLVDETRPEQPVN